MTPGALQTIPSMGLSLRIIRVFIASPSDIVEERQILDAIVSRLNQQFTRPLGILLEVVKWEQVPPSMGRPQGVILSHSPPETWDVFIGIIWQRFGSPTGGKNPSTGRDYESGTEEEFSCAYRLFEANGKPLIQIYRCNRPHIGVTSVDQVQALAVENFFRRFAHDGEHPGLYRSYGSSEEFEQLLLDHLNALVLKLSRDHSAWLASSRTPTQDQDYSAHARASLKPIVAGWRSALELRQDWGVAPHLRNLESDDASDQTTVYSREQFVQSLSERRSILLLGLPGAGKTSTLLRLADDLLDDERAPLPFLASVSAWVLSEQELDTYIVDRLVRLGIPRDGAEGLLTSQKIAVLLDGWNEAPEAGNTSANIRLRSFVLGRPHVPLVVTTRRSSRAPSLPEPIVLELCPLSLDQKVAVISATLDDPSALTDLLDSNQALRAVTDTPLFLSAALEIESLGQPIPTTRFELLSGFIRKVELRHKDGLNDPPCHGFHQSYLEAIARGMTARGETTIARDSLQALIAAESRRLMEGGQLLSPGATPAVLENLVRHHCLVLQPGVEDTYLFVHQQFQEWFASRWLWRQVMSLNDEVSAGELFSFQRDVLDHGHWQEALVFAAEAFAVAGNHASLARLTHWMMPIDLIAAAGARELVGSRLGSSLVPSSAPPSALGTHGRGYTRNAPWLPCSQRAPPISATSSLLPLRRARRTWRNSAK